MPDARDYFFRERYAGISLIPRLSEPLRSEVEALIDGYEQRRKHPESDPTDYSQELLMYYNGDARAMHLSGRIKFPFYGGVGGEFFWRSQRSQTPYLERIVEFYPHLSIELAEQLWLERARGMPGALPGPNELRAGWSSMSEVTLPPASSDVSPGPYAAAIVTPRCGVGGAEKTMREVAASIERQTGLPSLIVVADTQVDPGDLPHGAICLPNMTLRGEPFLRRPKLVRAMALRDLLVRMNVPRVFSMNSFLGNAMFLEGALQREGVRTASVLFCVGVGDFGVQEGYIQIADWLIDAGVTLFTDNDNVARILARQSFYDGTIVLAMPETVTKEPAPSGANVLWAGRIDTQKRPDLLVDIAKLSPHITYEVWGAPLLSESSVMDDILSQPNIVYRGPFEAFSAIDMTNIACLLYTSEFDGTPNLLLEALARGLPCLCTAVGGIPDLMADDRGVLVDAEASPAAYVAALDRLLGDPVARRVMSDAGRDYIRRDHSVEVFDQTVALLLETM